VSQPLVPNQDISTFDNDSQLEATHANMLADGVSIETRPIVDYWSYGGTENWILPGQEGVPAEYQQYITIKKMTEEDKIEFQTKTNKDIRVQKTTQDIKLNVNPALERKVLLELCVTGWFLFKPVPVSGGRTELKPIGYNAHERAVFFKGADPRLVQDLETAIRRLNPWMRNEATPEEIKQEIANLEEQLAEAVAREEAK